MAHVLAYSARQHCPSWDIRVKLTPLVRLKSAMKRASHVHNTQKLDYWAACVDQAADGTSMVLLDADTVILRPLDDLWAQPFDLAYTVRAPGSFKYPINGGVICLHVNPGTRAFMAAWCQANRRMLGDRDTHVPWRTKYGGINQASFGYALEHDMARGLDVRELPCQEWNCEDSAWRTFSPATRILHIKSSLRNAIFDRVVAHDYLRPLMKLWESIETASVSHPSLIAR